MGRKTEQRIKPTKVPEDVISFSYRYLRKTEKFNYECKDTIYFCKVIQRLKQISSYTPRQLKTNRSQSLRCNPIDWDGKGITEECFGLPREDELVDQPYEFQISANKHGRVHGFFIGPVFYIVWFDPDHNLFSR